MVNSSEKSQFVNRKIPAPILIIMGHSEIIKQYKDFESEINKIIDSNSLHQKDSRGKSREYVCSIPTYVNRSFEKIYNEALSEFKIELEEPISGSDEVKCYLCDTKLPKHKVKMRKKNSDLEFYIGVDCADKYSNEDYVREVNSKKRLNREMEFNKIFEEELDTLLKNEEKYKDEYLAMPYLLLEQIRRHQKELSRLKNKLLSLKTPLSNDSLDIQKTFREYKNIDKVYDEFEKFKLCDDSSTTYKISKKMLEVMEKDSFFEQPGVKGNISEGFLPHSYWHRVPEREFSMSIVSKIITKEFSDIFDCAIDASTINYTLSIKKKKYESDIFNTFTVSHSRLIKLLKRYNRLTLDIDDIFLKGKLPNHQTVKITLLESSRKYFENFNLKPVLYYTRDKEFYLKQKNSEKYFRFKWSEQIEKNLKSVYINKRVNEDFLYLGEELTEIKWKNIKEFMHQSVQRNEGQIIYF